MCFSSLPLSSPGFPLGFRGVQPRLAHALIAAWVFLAAALLAWVHFGFGSPASPRTCTHCRALFLAAVVLAWVPPWISGGPASPRTRVHCRMAFPRCRCPRLVPFGFRAPSLAVHLHSLPHGFSSRPLSLLRSFLEANPELRTQRHRLEVALSNPWSSA